MEEAERRREEAFVGEWTVVESAPSRSLSTAPREEGEDVMKVEDGYVKLEDGVEVGQKRPFPATADDDEDAGHRWKLRKKTAAVGLGELYDPGVMKLKPRVKSQPADAYGEAPGTIGGYAAGWTGEGGENRPKATQAPKWTTMKWRKPGEAPESEAPVDAQATSASPPVQEDAGADTSAPLTGDATTAASGNGAAAVKQEEIDTKQDPGPTDATVAAGHEPLAGLFKKRKRPVRN